MAAKTLSSAGVLYTERREFNLNRNDDIHLLYPTLTPFLGWLNDLESAEVDDPDFKMFQDTGFWRYQRAIVNGSPSAWSPNGNPKGTVSVDVDGIVGLSSNCDDSWLGVMVEIYDTNKTTLKGVAFVSAVTDTNTIVLKAIGNPVSATQTMTALADNDILEVVGHAWGEGHTAPEASEDELTVVWNSTGITRTAIDITGTLYKTALRGGGSSELERLRRVKMKEHKMRLEKKYLFSWRIGGIGGTAYGAANQVDSTFVDHATDAGSRTVRTTAGYIPILRRYGRTSGDLQNVFSFTKATNKYSDWVDMMEKLMQYADGPVRRAFCGPSVISYLNSLQMMKNSDFKIEISELKQDKLGYNVQYVDTGHGVLEMVVLNSLRQTAYANYVLLPHADHIERKFFRPDAFHANIKKDNNYDGIKDEYFSDDGLCLTQVDKHGLIILQ